MSMTYGFLVAKVVWNLELFTRSFHRISGPKAGLPSMEGLLLAIQRPIAGIFLRGCQ